MRQSTTDGGKKDREKDRREKIRDSEE